MPAKMKNIRTQALTILLVLFGGTTLINAGQGTPNKVRYKVDEALVSSGVDADATGRVQAFVKQQGNSDHQRLRVTVNDLDPKTPYTLLALVGTNEEWIAVTEFTTSSGGKGKVTYFQNRALTDDGHNGDGAGVNKHALPEGINPLTDVRALAIADSNGVTVLSVNLHESLAMEFELSSIFNNTGSDPDAIGCVAVACQNGSVQFRLFAAGSSSEYTFCVNDAPVATYDADWAGRISIGAFPSGAPSPLMFKTLDVRNGGNTVVLKGDIR